MEELLNSRNKFLKEEATRVLGAGVYITSGVANSFTIPANGTTALPGVLTLTAIPSRYVAPQYTWSRRFGDTGNFVVIPDATAPILNVLGDAQFVTDATGTGIVQYRVDVIESGTLGANPSNFTLTIPILRQGVNSVVGVLTNDSQEISVAETGVILNDTVIESTLIIYNGIIDDSANWSASIQSSEGISADLINGKTIRVNLPVDTLNGYVDITATRQGYANVVKRFNISKVIAVSYNVVIESTNGDTFRPNGSFSTILIARVFRNAEEVTDSLDPTKFRWTRVSYYPQPPPFDDSTWNQTYSSGYKSIVLSASEVWQRATFHCDILN